MAAISHHIHLNNPENQRRLSLHAEKHVAVSAGDKLRLEEEKYLVFFPLLLGECFGETRTHTSTHTKEKPKPLQMLRREIWFLTC